jgi:hypothetical protein
MQLLDSRASRTTPSQTLLTVHAGYIGGPHAGYRKRYYAAQLDLDDAVGKSNNPGLQRAKTLKGQPHSAKLTTAIDRWRSAMNDMNPYGRLRQVALLLGRDRQRSLCPRAPLLHFQMCRWLLSLARLSEQHRACQGGALSTCCHQALVQVRARSRL